MNATKHTPGPWKRESSACVEYVSDCQGDGGWIAEMLGDSDEECVANARLMAAAPEMLRILKDIRYNLDQPDGRIYGSGFIFEEDEEAREVIRKVIAQAEGENL